MKQIEITPFGFFATTSGSTFWSADGKEWRIWNPEVEFGPNLSAAGGIHALFPSPDQDRLTLLLLANAPAESTIATLATTTDGLVWERGLDSVATEFDSSTIAGIVPGGDGLLAFGSSPGGEFTPIAAVFTSPDGLGWRRVTPRTDDFENKVITDVIEFDGGFVAVGGDFFQTGLMTAWTSPDGITWTRSPHPDDPSNPSVAFSTANTVTADSGRLWAAGVDFDASRAQRRQRAAWVSDDGIAWARIDLDQASEVTPFALLAGAGPSLGVWPPNDTPSSDPYQLFLTQSEPPPRGP